MSTTKPTCPHPAYLALADGSVFHGFAFGERADAAGEVIFNTGMTGYQEIITDPSYAGQFVVLTTPEIGNYGCCREDEESRGVFCNGLIVHSLNPPSNFRAEWSLDAYLQLHRKPGLYGIDTRALTLLLRDKGNQNAFLHVDGSDLCEAEAVRRAREWEGLDGQDYAARVTTDKPYDFNTKGKHLVAAYDFGVKRNILRMLAERDIRVRVFPAKTPAVELLACNPDGIFLSNGPADPAAVTYAIEAIRELLRSKRPMMGICLGHQLLGLACGAKTERLAFGHHGCNHPVQNLADSSIEITSQNHNFAIRETSLPDTLEITHRNLNDGTIEGIRHKTLPAFAVQYHPEAAPGPHDAAYLFHQFKKLMEETK